MIRRSFLKRMALAAAACAFIDVPWPKAQTPAIRMGPLGDFQEYYGVVTEINGDSGTITVDWA